jgi:hypothetical protein
LPRLAAAGAALETALADREDDQNQDLPLVGAAPDPVPDTAPLLRAFGRLCQRREAGDNDGANKQIRLLKKLIEKKVPEFEGSRQQDAHEFLGYFMDRLKDTVKEVLDAEADGLAVTDATGVVHRLANPVVEEFQLARREEIRCVGCQARTVRDLRDTGLFCELDSSDEGRSVSLQELLERSQRAEERERRCEACGHSMARVESTFITAPRALVLNLKRYKYVQESSRGAEPPRAPEKISCRVRVPGILSLHPLLAPDCELPAAEPPLRLAAPPGAPGLPPAPGTPVKFKGKTVAELAKLSETDQVIIPPRSSPYPLHQIEYAMYRSGADQPEEPRAAGGMTEEEQLQAALQASAQVWHGPVWHRQFPCLTHYTPSGFSIHENGLSERPNVVRDRS